MLNVSYNLFELEETKLLILFLENNVLSVKLRELLSESTAILGKHQDHMCCIYFVLMPAFTNYSTTSRLTASGRVRQSQTHSGYFQLIESKT